MPDGDKPAPRGCYWRGETLWGRATVAGVEHRWSLRTSVVETARQRRETEHRRLKAAAHFGDDRKTWETAVIAWTEHIQENASANTVKRYAVSIKQVTPYLRGHFLDEIDKALLSSLIRARRAKAEPEAKRLSNATIRRDLTAISSVLGFCEDEGWLDSNPVLAQLKRLKERRDPIVLPDPDHIRYVITRAPGMFAALIEAAWRTGCRLDELASIKRRQIDLRRGQVSIIGKGNKLRTIDMLDAEPVFRAAAVNMRSQFVFWHGIGDPYANVSSRFAAITESAQKSAQAEGMEFRRFRFHDLRHRFAVDYLKEGRGSVYELRDHLGHRHVSTTEIYLKHLTPEEARLAKQGAAQKPAPMSRFPAEQKGGNDA